MSAGESVEQAALRRSLETEWTGRARREATALLAGCGMFDGDYLRWSAHETMVTLVALGWLQGANYADHRTLSAIEDAFAELRAAL